MSDFKLDLVPTLVKADQWAKWAHSMVAWLTAVDLWSVMEDSRPAATATAERAQWDSKNSRALGAMMFRIDPTLGHLKMKPGSAANPAPVKRTAKELWDELEKLFGKTDTVLTWTRFESIMYEPRLDESKPLQEQFNKLSYRLREVSNGGLKLAANMEALLVMSKLPESYRTMVAALLSTVEIKDLTVDLVTSKAMSEENLRKTGTGNPTANRVSVTKPKSKGPCGFCGGASHDESHCWKKHPNLKPKRGNRNNPKKKENSSGNNGSNPSSGPSTILP